MLNYKKMKDQIKECNTLGPRELAALHAGVSGSLFLFFRLDLYQEAVVKETSLWKIDKKYVLQ